ncbi:MAG TPA: DUF4129 domain-containing protein [Ktedonobacterales bacterium]
MENEATLARSSSARRGRAPFWSNRRAQAVMLLGALILVEMLPVEAWLIVFAGGVRGSIANVAAPLWFLVLVMTLAWAVAWRFERLGVGRVLLVSAPLFLLAWLTLLRISPSAYGAAPLHLNGVLDPLLIDLTHGVRHFSDCIALTALLAYVWWRGLMLGSKPPSHDDVLRRFQWSLVAFLLALFGLASTSGSTEGSLFGAISLLLPVEVFVCLTAAALANVSLARLRSRESQTGETESRWVGSAILLAGLVAMLALVINIFVNFESVSTLLRQMGPVGVAVDGAAQWLISGFIQVLGLVIDRPLQAFFDWIQSHGQRRPPQTSTPTCSQQSSDPMCIRARTPQDVLNNLNTVQRGVVIALDILVVAVVIVVFIVMLRRLLARQSAGDGDMVQEEREALGGRGLFGAQVRSLFARPRRKAQTAEQLAAGTVRALYRDMLRAAKRVGLGREGTETPDEYARRLVEAGPLAGAEAERGDVAALSAAYDGARYGEREPAPKEQAALRERAKRVIGRLRSQPPPAR